ncbi:NAD(P)-dependent oxidoreductase [Fodinicurvata sp. EGI_FJ10296]|uniref:NAD(P)-dependent oxidoreductase n=1 Tax=Fodinicurvata sp. EGI_FJ10296 TaxID=3231908 RepID=UPI0034553BA0
MADPYKIGFIGLGLMGEGMATCIVKAGHRLTVTANRNRAPVDRLVAAGAAEADTPAAVARDSDFVVVCVATAEQVDAIVTGPDGILSAAHPGLTVIDCTTSHPDVTRRVAGACSAAGVSYMDAPLARTPTEAWEGRLNIMAGADDAVLERARPVLSLFAENIFHIGPVGSGHALKLINNFLSIGAATLTVEAALAARSLGVDHRKLFEVCSAGGANSAMFQAVMPWILDGDDTKMRFSIANARKDMGYLKSLAEKARLPATVLPAVSATLEAATSGGAGDDYIPKLYNFALNSKA